MTSMPEDVAEQILAALADRFGGEYHNLPGAVDEVLRERRELLWQMLTMLREERRRAFSTLARLAEQPDDEEYVKAASALPVLEGHIAGFEEQWKGVRNDSRDYLG